MDMKSQDGYAALWGPVQRPNPLLSIEGIAVPDPRKRRLIMVVKNFPFAGYVGLCVVVFAAAATVDILLRLMSGGVCD